MTISHICHSKRTTANHPEQELLKFSDGKNQAKLGKALKRVWSFSLPSGFSCPFALDCLSKADRETGKITDGPETKYRCFSATTEAAFPTARKQRWHNFDQLRKYKDCEDCMAILILDSMPVVGKIDYLRVHVGGDYFNLKYLRAFLQVAEARPDVHFYSYTKSLPYWTAVMERGIPENFEFNASRGGRMDSQINEYGLKEAVVVFHPDEAAQLGLEIDHDESMAISKGGSFALLLHGTQPKDSEASQALKTMRTENIEYAYSSK